MFIQSATGVVNYYPNSKIMYSNDHVTASNAENQNNYVI